MSISPNLPLRDPAFAGLRPLFALALFVLAAAAVIAHTLHSVPVPGTGVFSICLFRDLTSLPCPGCGLTRGLVALLAFDLTAALRYHPFSPAAVATLILFVLAAVFEPLARVADWLRSGRVIFAATMLLMVFGLARITFILGAPDQARTYIYDFAADRGVFDSVFSGSKRSP